MKKYLSTSFDKVVFWLLSVVVVLLPIFTVSVYGLAPDVAKKFVLVIAVFLAALFWLVGRLQENSFTLPKNWILAAGGLVGISFLVSGLFSSSIWHSLIGIGYEQMTFLSIFVYLLLMFLFSIIFQSKSRILNFYVGIFLAFAVVFVFQSIRILWASLITTAFPLAIFSNPAVNLIGKWNDLGLFCGLIAILALVLRELLPAAAVNRLTQIFLNTVLVASLVGVAVVNFYEVWVLLGVAALLVLVYAASFNDRIKASSHDGQSAGVKVLRPALLVFLVALTFIVIARNGSWFSNSINTVNQKLGVQSLEVRPSWGGTSDILRQTIKSDPIFGVGPNKFVDQWVKYKPVGVNDTQFWNIDFNSGISFFPTVVVMTGVVGAIALALFLLAIISYGLNGLFNKNTDHTSRALAAATFLGLLYLLVSGFIYISDTVILTLTFALAGLFVAILHENKTTDNISISLVKDPKVNFASILTFVAVILISVTGGYFVVQKFWSVIVFQKALANFSADNNVDQAYLTVNKAVSLSKEDIYYRALAELNLLQMAQLLNEKDKTQEEMVAKFRALIDTAQSNVDKAISLNDSNYLNWVAKARIYEVLVPPPLAIPGAYEKAVEFYGVALKHNPNNPAIFFSLAQLEASQNKKAEAKDYLNKAIAQKRNYTNALFALAQLEIEDGNIEEVIKKVESAVVLSPNDAGLLFQLGFLYYRNENYKSAAEALNQAVLLNSNYSNARYFFGLALEKLGYDQDALAQFIEIEKLNPDNADVKNIIRNMRAGNPALYQAPAPEPDERQSPPIEEAN